MQGLRSQMRQSALQLLILALVTLLTSCGSPHSGEVESGNETNSWFKKLTGKSARSSLRRVCPGFVVSVHTHPSSSTYIGIQLQPDSVFQVLERHKHDPGWLRVKAGKVSGWVFAAKTSSGGNTICGLPKHHRVCANGVSLRSSPTLRNGDSNISGWLKPDQPIHVTQLGESGSFLKVATRQGKQGWVLGTHVCSQDSRPYQSLFVKWRHPITLDPNGRNGTGPFCSSGYAERIHPITGQPNKHRAIDVAATLGTPIAAVAGGYVIKAGVDGGLGNRIIIRHNHNNKTIYSLYAHLHEIYVRPGQWVSHFTGPIGTVGSTGFSTGPHLHLEALKSLGASSDKRVKTNPNPYFTTPITGCPIENNL